MGKFIDLTGKRFGRLVAISHDGRNKNKQTCWTFACDCGKVKSIVGQSVREGKVISCGCYMREWASQNSYKHGLSNHPCYQVWHGMMSRCYDESNRNWKSYGSRGIKVCDRWHSMENFISDTEPKPEGMSIDRINVNGDYAPDNWRWATDEMQNRNRQDSINVVFNGIEMPASHASLLIGGSNSLVSMRLKKGWSMEKALTTPVLRGKNKK